MAVEYPLVFGFIKIVDKTFSWFIPLKIQTKHPQTLFYALRAF